MSLGPTSPVCTIPWPTVVLMALEFGCRRTHAWVSVASADWPDLRGRRRVGRGLPSFHMVRSDWIGVMVRIFVRRKLETVLRIWGYRLVPDNLFDWPSRDAEFQEIFTLQARLGAGRIGSPGCAEAPKSFP